MDIKRVKELLEEATIDCYDEEEEFSGVLNSLGDNLQFPLQAKLAGDLVEVVDLDEGRSSLRRGVVARVRKGDREHSVSLVDLTFVNPDPTSADWLAMYSYWADLWLDDEEEEDDE
jgi:hypothetical protein